MMNSEQMAVVQLTATLRDVLNILNSGDENHEQRAENARTIIAQTLMRYEPSMRQVIRATGGVQ